MTNKKDSAEMSGLRQRTHDGIDMIMDKAESIGERGMKTVDNIKERAVKVKDGIDGYIRKNPIKTVLYAAGAGAAAGVITTAAVMRRKRKIQS